MKYIVNPSSLKGEIIIPPSKSETLRAIVFAAMGSKTSNIYNYLNSDDTKSMIEACRLLGAKIEVHETHLEVVGLNGKIGPSEDVLHAGNSGIVLRFCSALAALSKYPIVMTGDHSIRHKRPMQALLHGLSQLHVKAISTKEDGFAPVIIQGPIIPQKVIISGKDSQPVSALLIASVFAQGEIEIHVEDPGEKPWVALTLSWFDRLNIPYTNENFSRYQTFGNASYEGFDYQVPGDLSSSAFSIAAALVTQSEILVKNVDMECLQGDKELIYVFQKMGALIEIDKTNKTILVKKGSKLVGITVDINDFIDCITILSVVACFAEGVTHIRNCLVAKEKECNRIAAIIEELRKMGANISETEDGLMVQKSELKGAVVHSHHDHRMCMSLAVAALGSVGETCILESACVKKTYPSFLSDFQALVADILEQAKL